MDTKQKLPPRMTDSAKALLKVLHGDVEGIKIPQKTIITAIKIKNSILRKFVEKFEEFGNTSDEQLVRILLTLDEMVENDHLTDELLKSIKKDPRILDNLTKK
jgi:hypothetical protein